MLAETLFWTSTAVVTYHHAAFPWVLDWLAHRPLQDTVTSSISINREALPKIAIVIPAYNEAAFIRKKLLNLAMLEYPRELLRIVLICDGCRDDTDLKAQSAMERPELRELNIELHSYSTNLGKVARLNAFIEKSPEEIVVLSDVSAMLPSDALLRVANHMADKAVGVVCGSYRLADPGSEGEALYWKYQVRIKRAEALMAAPIGAHGAFYAIRRSLWTPLEPDTINDDFILPMRIIVEGAKGIYDPEIEATELETAKTKQDIRRRVRIGAGNMQQLIRLFRLASPRRPVLAFLFLSGKGLRAVVPLLFFLMLVTSGVLALQGGWLYPAIFASQLVLYALASVKWLVPDFILPRHMEAAAYAGAGMAASFAGVVRYLAGLERGRWKRVTEDEKLFGESRDFIPLPTRVGKRCLDVAIALFAFIIMIILFPFIALAIRLDSPGPIFYRQLRVGAQTTHSTKLFPLMKFRTMRVDAEVATGPVWAQTNDPRITRVGRFMRKSRLDELPQCLNVLRGEMSIVGPRPERPSFFSKLENDIPFYIERTFGLRPGITGLAQISQGYDASIEDVRSKVMHDHVYAMRLMHPREWLLTDLTIMFRTFTIMALGKGQ